MRRTKLPYATQWIDDADRDRVERQLQDDWLTQGPRVAEFEQAVAERCGTTFAVAVSSGTAALHLASLVAGMGPGKTGITSANTFVASANCIAYTGGSPTFCDVDPDTGLMDLSDLDRRCRSLADGGHPPDLLIPVDFAGQPPDLVRVREIADRYGSVVIEDAAHSLGAEYIHKNEAIACASCRHTDMAILSFHPVKHITTGEGGMITTNSREYYQNLLLLRSHGITKNAGQMEHNDGPWYYEQLHLGFNYRLTDLQCSLGLSQLGRLSDFIARRRLIALRYSTEFQNAPFSGKISPLHEIEGVKNSFHLYVVRILPGEHRDLDEVRSLRLQVFQYLVDQGILPQIHYIPVTRQPYYRKFHATVPSDFPGAESYYAGCISLPMFPRMSDQDVDRVITTLATAVKEIL